MSEIQTTIDRARDAQKAIFDGGEGEESVARYLRDSCRSRQTEDEYPHPLSTIIPTASIVGINLCVWREAEDRVDPELIVPIVAATVDIRKTAVEDAGDGVDVDHIIELLSDDSSVAARKQTVDACVDLLADADGIPADAQEDEPLAYYAALGMGFARKASGGNMGAAVQWLSDVDPYVGEQIQRLSVTAIEQPLIYAQLHSLTREVIVGKRGQGDPPDPYGMLLGSSPEEIVYLGDDPDGIEDAVHSNLLDRITEQHSFYVKAAWNTHEHGVLPNIPIPYREKHRIIAECYTETLLSQSGHEVDLEDVPAEIERCLPELVKILYDPQDNNPTDRTIYDWFSGQPTLEELYRDKVEESTKYNSQSSKIGFLAELVGQCTGVVAGHYDTQTIYNELEDFRAKVEPLLRDDLQTTVDLASEVTQVFFHGLKLDADAAIDSTKQCFLCGKPATTDFEKGFNAFYGTSKFAKKVGPEQEVKKICPGCELEHALVRDICELNGTSSSHDTAVGYLYRDVFCPGILTTDNRQVAVFDEDEDQLSDELLEESFGTPFQAAPFWAPGNNGRNRALREFIPLVGQGMKVQFSGAFTAFAPTGDLIHHQPPTPTIAAFGLASVRDYESVEKTAELIGLMESLATDSEFSNNRSYELLTENSFDEIVGYIVDRTQPGFDSRKGAERLIQNNDEHTRKLKQMQDVARAAHKLIGEQYKDHSKKEPFDACVESLIEEFDSHASEEALIAYVAGQVHDVAKSQRYSGIVTAEEAEVFTRCVVDAFKARGQFSRRGLIENQTNMRNAYIYAYDRILEQVRDAKQRNKQAAGDAAEAN